MRGRAWAFCVFEDLFNFPADFFAFVFRFVLAAMLSAIVLFPLSHSEAAIVKAPVNGTVLPAKDAKTASGELAKEPTKPPAKEPTKPPAKKPTKLPAKKPVPGTTERDVPVYLWGDYVEYKTESQKIIAKGNAVAEHKKMHLSANVIQADLKDEKIIAYGNVIYSQEEGGRKSEMEAQFLVYHMRTGEGRITGGYTEKHMQAGNEYYKIGEIQYHIDESFATDIELSTCDNFREAHSREIASTDTIAGRLYHGGPGESAMPSGSGGDNCFHGVSTGPFGKCFHKGPHWKVHAARAKIYPKEHMVLYNVNYFIGGKKIWHSRSMIIPLKQQKKKPFKPGYSKIKGFYFTASLDRHWTKSNYGTAEMDFSTKQGVNITASHRYEKSKSDISTSLDYRNISRTDPITGGVIANFSESVNFNLSERYKFDAKTNANFNMRYTSNRSKSLADLKNFLPANEEINLNLDVTQANKNYDLALRVRQRMDPDGTDYPQDDRIQVLDMEPELTLKTKNRDIGRTSLGWYSEFLVGKYFERAYHDLGDGTMDLTDLTTVKRDAQFNLFNKPLKFLKIFTSNFKSRYRRSSYTTGHEKEVVDHSLQLKVDFLKNLYANFSYNHRNASGFSPLSTDDREMDLNNVRGDMVLEAFENLLRFNLLSANYDYMTNRFYGVNSSLSLRSQSRALNRWNLNLTGNYDLGQTRLSEWGMGDLELLNLSARYNIERVKRWKFTTSMYYDNRLGKLQNMTGQWDLPLGEVLKLTVDSRYDFNRGEFTQLNYAATVNIHCWEARMDWNKQTEDFNFSIYLKAYPEKAIKANYDGLTKSIKPSFGSNIGSDNISFGDFL